MTTTIAISLAAIVISLANLILIAVLIVRMKWEDGWKWRYRNWRNDRYVRSLQNHSK